IAPERVSNDPLINLGEAGVEEEEKVGALEDLFMETKQADVVSDDPIAHLQFSMQREDDHLIRDVEKPKAAQAQPIENKRQVVDDSFSVHSEFDIPNLIPEDWLGGAATRTASVKPVTEQAVFIPEDFAQTQSVSPRASVVQSDVNKPQYEATLNHVSPNVSQRAESVGQKWEEVTRAFIPSAQSTQQESKVTETKVGFVSNES
ncbi:signal peptide protein, partial [Vibrio vulnificus]